MMESKSILRMVIDLQDLLEIDTTLMGMKQMAGCSMKNQ